MCGIMGYWSLGDNRPEQGWINASIGQLAHRGPDHEGIWFNSAHEVGLGHRRLSIIDVSEDGNQPMLSGDSQLSLVFNGHIYNYVELRDELKEKGHRFKSDSDTEVLLRAYEQWGKGCLKRLYGFFAFAIWDQKKQTLFLARDRLGEKPLYYSLEGETFKFASEPKPLPKGNLDATSLADFVIYGFVPSPKTMWGNIAKLPPATSMEVVKTTTGLKVRQEVYWRPSLDSGRFRNENEIIEGLAHYCEEAAKRTTRSDVPLGCLLSGGVDSSGVVAFLAKRSSSPIRTFAVGFGSADGDELPWAKKVANRYDTEHRELICDAGHVENSFGRMSKVYSEPFDDGSQVPCNQVFEETAKHCKVVLTGDGADEIFCGYPRFTNLKKLTTFRDLCPRFMWGKTVELLHRRSKPGTILESQLYRIFASDEELLCDLSAAAIRPRDLRDVFSLDLAGYDPRSHIANRLSEVKELPLLTQMRYLDVTFKLPEQMMFKVDRASMAAPIESRAFFLYLPLLEFSLSLSTRNLIRNGGKYYLKKMLEDYVPHDNLYRPKRGFGLTKVRPSSWLSSEMELELKNNLQVNYGKALGETNSMRAQRLYFGARSLYEWYDGAQHGGFSKTV
jgi:asparagine synthase (glutamine-hydrolysing)